MTHPKRAERALEDFEKWLDSIKCTAPFTLDDARELQKMLKAATQSFERVATEVVIYGKQVRVAVWIADAMYKRTFDVV